MRSHQCTTIFIEPTSDPLWGQDRGDDVDTQDVIAAVAADVFEADGVRARLLLAGIPCRLEAEVGGDGARVCVCWSGPTCPRRPVLCWTGGLRGDASRSRRLDEMVSAVAGPRLLFHDRRDGGR